jgi:hypothetical protein
MMLPGSATDSVYRRPPVGWNTADGLEVSTSCPVPTVEEFGNFEVLYSSPSRFRFWVYDVSVGLVSLSQVRTLSLDFMAIGS